MFKHVPANLSNLGSEFLEQKYTMGLARHHQRKKHCRIPIGMSLYIYEMTSLYMDQCLKDLIIWISDTIKSGVF